MVDIKAGEVDTWVPSYFDVLGWIHSRGLSLTLRCLDIRTVFTADLKRQDVFVHSLPYSAA